MSDHNSELTEASLKCTTEIERKERAVDTLAAFVRDSEHELLSVVTALQAQVDVLHAEQLKDNIDPDRFFAIDRIIARLITNASVLVSVSDLAKAPRSEHQNMVEQLMQEVAHDTQLAFSTKKVSLSSDIATGMTLTGERASLKLMLTGMLLSVLHQCKKLDVVRIVGQTDKRLVSLSFCAGLEGGRETFKPWQLGELRLLPMNGDGIALSAVEAMARMHDGQLGVKTLADQSFGYRLIFME